MFVDYVKLQRAEPSYRWSPLLSNHDGTRIMTILGGSVPAARQAATLLLTLPGLPIVYYGEEIGMTGDKPDPRLRTPMQWAPEAGYGFTTGHPWEAAQPDSMTTTVAAENRDPGSLLNLYRRLIHLRASNDALASGHLTLLQQQRPRGGLRAPHAERARRARGGQPLRFDDFGNFACGQGCGTAGGLVPAARSAGRGHGPAAPGGAGEPHYRLRSSRDDARTRDAGIRAGPCDAA